jgi:hypothetical protein
MKRLRVFTLEKKHYLSVVPDSGFNRPDLEHIEFIHEMQQHRTGHSRVRNAANAL